MPTITGTDGDDVLNGTAGRDIINGLGGNDVIYGGDGDDVIDGGDGDDVIHGGDGDDHLICTFGDDTAYGGAGDDYIQIRIQGDDFAYGEDGNDLILAFRSGTHAPDTFVLDGGAGHDELRVIGNGRMMDTAIIRGGTGDDVIFAAGIGEVHIDAGDGDDRLDLSDLGGRYDITLGAGQDLISIGGSTLNNPYDYGSGLSEFLIRDFQAGADGDRIALLPLAYDRFEAWDNETNFFDTGHARIIQVGDDSLLQIDFDGGGDNFVTLITFSNIDSSSLTADNFGGYSPLGGAPIGTTIIGTENRDVLSGTQGDDLIQGLGGNDDIYGNAGDDVLEGGDGNDRMNGGVGDDHLDGGDGDDHLEGGDGNDRLEGNAGNDVLRDSGGNDQLFGGDGDDTLTVAPDGLGPFPPTMPGEPPRTPQERGPYTVYMDGGNGDDRLEFIRGRGIDTVTLIGGAGADTILVQGAAEVIIDAGSGDDLVVILSPTGDHRVTTGDGRDRIVLETDQYFEGAPTLTVEVTDFQAGQDGDRLEFYAFIYSHINSMAPAYTDMFAEGYARLLQIGDDTYVQALTEEGEFRTLYALNGVHAADMTADNFVWDYGDVDPGALLIYGTDADETLRGRGWDDRIDGGDGDDHLIGLGGNDTLIGGRGDDTMVGGEGDDTYYVDSSRDVVIELGGQGRDHVYSTVTFNLNGQSIEDATLIGTLDRNLIGNDGNNVLTGNSGDNIIIGGRGADTMAGGAGDDIYYVDSRNDVVVELAGAGYDIVRSTVSFDGRFTEVEEIQLLGADAANAVGNDLNNRLIGNSAANILNGGRGADTMIGGEGDDIYYVDNIGDVIIEAEGQGRDHVYSTISFNLNGQSLEDATLLGAGNTNLIGNDGDNVLTGNSGANILNGGRGADTMAGGAGDDIYYVDSSRDVVIEAGGQGRDHVYSTVTFNLNGQSIEDATLIGTLDRNLIGNTGHNVLTGNSGANIIIGGGGVDTIDGGAGNDVLNGGARRDYLTGGAGSDRFVYTNVSDSSYADYDRIMDLSDEDIIDLSGIDADINTEGDQAFALVDSFTGQAGQITLTYNAGAGFTVLAADVNGDGLADMRIVLYGNHEDFSNFWL